MTVGKCDGCGAPLWGSRNTVPIGPREFCGPRGSDCHTLGELSAGWTLTEAEAVALLIRDAARVNG